ncbi:MAG: tRNA lysidine(34) synthetase TilS [Oscillospiraceae bacterium]|nr:tRNA lysidine(34) synthetase TilS [Oscillospiraceae bacterium]
MDLTGWMAQWNMFPPPGGLILCAVSGGRDSMCLLHYLHQLSRERDFRVAAAHLNHGMRQTAERDEGLVRSFCAEREIPFYAGYEKVYDRAREWDLSVEETGRRLRYAFLARTAEETGADRIATAHHMGDQAETVLLNLLRGTGPEGLGGIPPVRGKLIRPLLNTSRQEIEEYLDQWNVDYVEDETNMDLTYARNRLRLEIWPELERINGAARENIARAARILRRENTYLNELAAQRLPAEGTSIPCRELTSAPEVLRPRMLRLLIDRLRCGKKDFGESHLSALERLAESGGMLDLPGGARAVCRGGVLTLERADRDARPETVLQSELPVRWEQGTICLQSDLRSRVDEVIRLSVGAGQTISVRTWRSGDRLTLPGSRGSRSLKRLFADVGIDPARREKMPVICVDGQAAAVFRVGTDQRFTPGKNEKQVIITWKKRT